MKIIHNYLLDDKTHPGYFLIISNEEHICSGCHRPMKCKDRRARIGKTFDGDRTVYLIRRMYCPHCHVMHNELPDFLIKFKHYEVQIIEDAIDGNLSFEDGYEAPSETTMHRWCVWFDSLRVILDSILYAIRAMLDDILPNLLGELMISTDEWLRRRIRTIYWKQWKKIKTRYRNLRALKISEGLVHELANSRKGYWRMGQMLNVALTNKVIAHLGYTSMTDYYLNVCEN